MSSAGWKHPHIIVLGFAALLAFVGGYALGTRGARPIAATSPVIVTNDMATAPRSRPDENALIAQNAEREEAARPPQPTPEPEARTEPPARSEPVERSEPRPPRSDPDRDRDFVEPGLEGEPPGGKPQDE